MSGLRPALEFLDTLGDKASDEQLAARPHELYLLEQPGGFVKFGITSSWDRRRATLQTGGPRRNRKVREAVFPSRAPAKAAEDALLALTAAQATDGGDEWRAMSTADAVRLFEAQVDPSRVSLGRWELVWRSVWSWLVTEWRWARRSVKRAGVYMALGWLLPVLVGAVV